MYVSKFWLELDGMVGEKCVCMCVSVSSQLSPFGV